MNNKKRRLHRKKRIQIFGSAKRPRVAVFRSSRYIYVQLIDDKKRYTLAGISDKKVAADIKNKIDRAKKLGLALAETAKQWKITSIVFDRSGYAYHGRVKALAEGLREGGLKF